MRGNHVSQMGCTTSSGDDDANAPVDGLAREIGGAVRRTVRRGDVDFVSNAKFFQRLAGLAHNLKVGITAHHDGNQRFAHEYSFLETPLWGSDLSALVTSPPLSV